MPDYDQLAEEIAEALYDNAHEGCCDDGAVCNGGGGQYWRKYVEHLIMPVVRGHIGESMPDDNTVKAATYSDMAEQLQRMAASERAKITARLPEEGRT